MSQKAFYRAVKYFTLFVTGGAVYLLIEILARGWTHWTMFIVGGLCFILVGLINEHCSHCREHTSLLGQMAAGALLITEVEFIAGCIINLWLGLNVWDYSMKPYNLLGQVCLENTSLWFLLSLPAVILDDWIRTMFGEKWPHYRLV